MRKPGVPKLDLMFPCSAGRKSPSMSAPTAAFEKSKTRFLKSAPDKARTVERIRNGSSVVIRRNPEEIEIADNKQPTKRHHYRSRGRIGTEPIYSRPRSSHKGGVGVVTYVSKRGATRDINRGELARISFATWGRLRAGRQSEAGQRVR